MRLVLAILFLSVLAGATLDQTYVQTLASGGNSTIDKTMDVTIFSNQLTNDTLTRMASVCAIRPDLGCNVDVKGKKITISQNFNSGGYYSYTTEYGFPFITETLTITKIPTDKFSSVLESILVAVNATDPSAGGGSVKPIDLSDTKTNQENAKFLKQFKANLTYIVNMPSGVSDAKAGNVSGIIKEKTVQFDLVNVLEASEPIVIKSNELNGSYIIGLLGVIVLVGLAFSFFKAKPNKKRK